MFVIHEHHASSLHWDVRLEHDGVLVSWAVPKGPPLETGVQRLAIQTEDHPMEYGTFEGTIPEEEYGGGEVSIWDTGTVEVEKWREGSEVIAVCHGQEAGGLGGIPRRYAFVHTGRMGAGRRTTAAKEADEKNWLLQLMKDQPGERARTRGAIKHSHHQEVVIIGWRTGTGQRESTFGSLLLAVPDADGTLRYAGRVGTGFSDRSLERLSSTLRSRLRSTPAAEDVPSSDRHDAQWVRADLVGEVQHSEVTAHGRLRHPVWRGLRSDTKAEDVTWEQ